MISRQMKQVIHRRSEIRRKVWIQDHSIVIVEKKGSKGLILINTALLLH